MTPFWLCVCQNVLRTRGMAVNLSFLILGQVYDITFEAALRAQSCGPNQLVVTGEWHWLLSRFADAYGIREFYTNLSHLRWILR